MSTSTKTYAPCGSAAPQRRTDPCADDRMPSCPACGGLECLCRPRFFPGQLLTDEDLNRLEQYVIGKNRLRNRYLHGWGVACGLEVRCDPCDPAQVVVHNGYALSPCGDDIVVGGDQAVDICALIRECAPRREPVCDPPWNNPPEDCSARSRRWVLAICYDERPVRGITAQLGMGDTRCGCACGGSSCGCGTAAGSAVSGGGATPSPSRRRKATNPQCEPTQICEGYRFIAYPAPAEAPDQKVPTGDQLWPWLYAHRARYGPLIERVLCCAAQAMELRSRFDQNNGEDVDARAYVEYASALKAFLDEFPLGCSSIGDQDFGNLKLNLTPISRNVNPNQPPPKISDLDAILSKILTQCFCSALLPACPPPSPDNCVPLAVVTLAGDRCRVAGVCNWEARKLLLTWRTMEHWFSWLPWSRLQDWIAGLCCGGSQKMTVDLSALLFARIFQQDLAPRSKDRDPQIWDFNYERVRARAKELSALGASSTESDLSAAIARLIFEGKPTLSNLAMMNNVVERLEECEKRLKIEHD
ncbi:MAG: hypothetical protein KDH17_13130 [Rhodocyclaceae bacterium]|nr:hypothetical protein [Rhodocyclaceae bacterium]